jgi:adenosine deaminase
LAEDPVLTGEVRARHIPLEICLTSNVQTHAAETYEAHPLRRYFDQGMTVVLNTDNRLMSGVTLVDEYLIAARTFGFDFGELARLAMNGFESAFLPEAERSALVQRARDAIAAVGT